MIGGAVALVCALPAFANDLCYGHVTDRLPRTVPAMERPPYLKAYRDPAFGSRVLRISNTPAGEIVKTLYSTVQAWNADESRLILYHSGGADAGHHLYDGRTYEHLQQLPFAPSDIEELFWDPKRANTLYFVQKRPYGDPLHGKLVSYDIDSGQRTAIADVSRACGTVGTGTVPTAGADVHGVSGDFLGLRCNHLKATGGAEDRTFLVNVRNGNIGASMRIGPTIAIGGGTGGSLANIAIAPLPSNRRFLLQGSVFDSDMRFQHRVDRPLQRNTTARPLPRPEHDTVGRLSNGHDALFAPQFQAGPAGCPVGTLVAHDLQSRDCRVLIGPETGWDYPLSGIHHSALTSGGPGWIASSIVGYGKLGFLRNGEPAPTLLSEIVLTSNDPERPTTCRLAHTRTHGKSARRTAWQAYFGEPHPIISPSGTRILFSSDWYDSGTVDTFVIDVTAVSGAAAASGRAPARATPPERSSDTPDGVSLNPGRSRYGTDARTIDVTFSDPTGGRYDRVAIAPVGSPDSDLQMWLHTNGTQTQTTAGPRRGALSFLSSYLGTGGFEVRLFRRDSEDVVARRTFRIGD